LAVHRKPLAILNTIVFTIFVPGTVAGVMPYWLSNGFPLTSGPLRWLGALVMVGGISIYCRCAWEFAVRGLGTPAPIAPTQFLVTTALHRYVRNPMYIGVALVILGEAALCHSLRLVIYAAAMLSIVHVFVVFYEEPTLRRQFGESFEAYVRSVPRWIPKSPE
jgi:protein-S-isoprenylcysteine O-methyltransferase Ste14